MRKLSLVLAVVLVLSTLAAPALAAQSRAVTIIPELDFNNNVATCAVRITGNSFSEELDATIRLYRGSTLIATWTAEGNGYIFFSKTKTVTKGYTYKLTVDLKVNGVAASQVYTTGQY